MADGHLIVLKNLQTTKLIGYTYLLKNIYSGLIASIFLPEIK